MEPSLAISFKDEIPETNEKNTRGTTISFKRFLKISPPKLNMYVEKNSSINFGVILV